MFQSHTLSIVFLFFLAGWSPFASLHAQTTDVAERFTGFGSPKDEVFIAARASLRSALESGDSTAAAHAHYQLGQYYFGIGSFEGSMEHYLDAERMLANARPSQLLYAIIADLGRVYHYTGDAAGSLQYYREALDGYRAMGDSAGVADVYGRLGHFYEKQADYTTALDYQWKARRYFEPRNDSVAIARIFENMGSIYEDLLVLDSAAFYFMAALNYLSGSDDLYMRANLHNNLGDVKRKSGQTHEAIALTRMGLVYAEQAQSHYLRKSAYRDLAKSYSDLGNSDSAYHYLNFAYAQLDSIFTTEVAQQIARSQVIFDLERKEANLKVQKAEIALLEREGTLGRQVQYTLLVALFLLVAVGAYTFRTLRQKREGERLLFEQRETVYKARQELADRDLEHAALTEAKLKTELENKRLREIFLNEQLQLRSNELTSQTLKIIRKNKLLNQLKTKVEGGGSGDRVHEMRKLIDRHLRVDKNWEGFQELFEKVHDDFYRKLMQRAPDLSPAEIRLCCLLKLNLPSKDMAAMLGISPDSLRIARYRLRKKLQLDRAERLSIYILSL